MGYQSFSQQILHGSRENLSKTPPCVMVFYLQSKGFSHILRKRRRAGNCKDWELSREVNCGYCTLHPSSADHFSKLLVGFKCMLFSLDPSMKTSIQQEECCLGPTHFHYKRHGGRVHPVSLHPSSGHENITQGSMSNMYQLLLGLPQFLIPGCPAAQWLTALPPLGQECAAVTVTSSIVPSPGWRKQRFIPVVPKELSEERLVFPG